MTVGSFRSGFLFIACLAFSAGLFAQDAGTVLDDPGNLTGFRGREGLTLCFMVTGSTDGSLWGTDVYTDDSALAKACVHAGILAEGETGIVAVTILPGMPGYTSSTRNGVSTSSYGNWYGSYSVGEP